MSFLTFGRLTFEHRTTYRWRAVKEYFPNIYGFMGENLSVISLNSLTSAAYHTKSTKLILSPLKYKKLKFGIRGNNIYI